MDKQKEVVKMFDQIASRYDLANRVLSFGSDIFWRKEACKKAYRLYDNKNIQKVVDVACGTGDMLRFWEKVAKQEGVEVKEFIGVDPSKKMLEIAKKKFPNFSFLQAYAQNLPLENESSDIVSITYGLRNVTQRKEALKEFFRILKPKGILVILEFTRKEKKGVVDLVTGFYLKKVLPVVGGLISGNKEAYEYLPNSIENFLSTQELIEELKENGFSISYTKGYSFGISTLFIAQKL
ncbi:MAG: bifunctional demethylmenaquinone methyltransferase/2-methoxy-6-polyprenyl-1,4-benzoquinol methylase UbiE [Epsilonproteobacteria bacterium]|nr:bifunctional demethylmenaquinone methyltransferase/2-methoxy-6-polyprenyl-1,4-benzoquinol methylase UbiE [Campylobacterota bacterium]